MNEINGWTMRDEFAKGAITGMAASVVFDEIDDDIIAKSAYLVADAMLEARKPKEVPKDMPAKLAEMLEHYRNDLRDMPTYAELVALVQP